MKREFVLVCCLTGCGVLFFGTFATAGLVWQSTFDSSADGVVDIYNNDAGKVMIGTASGGRLPITSWDNSTNSFTPDKAGRPLGATLSGNNTMSGQYKFNWSTLNQSATQAYEAAGFLGNASPQTRQILGGILRHWKVGASDYYVALDIAVGSVGATAFGYLAGSPINLGTNPTANDYEYRVEYSGPSHVLSLSLLDSTGTLLGSTVANLDTDVPGLHQFSTPAVELGALALTHLGWSDYTGNGGDRATVWNTDSLAYYDTPQVVPEPASVGLAIISVIAVFGLRRGGWR